MMKLAIFDMDGVLIQSQEWHREALNRALKEIAGFHIDDPEFEGRPTKVKLEMLVQQEKISLEDMTVISELKKKYTDAYVEQIQTNHELVKMFSNLRKMDYRLAVASNAIKPFVDKVLQKLGILEFFDIVGGNEGVKPKPHPEMYIRIMKELKIPAEHTLIFEDSPVGLEAAFGSGANVCVVKNDIVEKVAQWLY